MPASSFDSSCPAAPTNGTPCLSSWKPGASPTNISSAAGLPEPKTTCVRPCDNRHFVQPATESAKTASSCIAGESRTAAGCSAAAAGAAAAAPAAETRLLAAADRREDGELLAHVLGAAVRTVGVLAHRYKLLVVGLALHA